MLLIAAAFNKNNAGEMECKFEESYTILCKHSGKLEKIEAPKKFIQTSETLKECILMAQEEGGKEIPVNASLEIMRYIITETLDPWSNGKKINKDTFIEVLKTVDMLHIQGALYNRLILTFANIFEKLPGDKKLEIITKVSPTIACDMLFKWLIEFPRTIAGLAVPRRFSPDSNKIVCTGYDGTGFSIYNSDTGDIIAKMDESKLDGSIKRILKIGWTADGHKILTLNRDNTASIWDADNLRHVFSVPCYEIAKCSPIEDKFFALQAPTTLNVFSCNEERLLTSITQDEKIEDAKWSPDGTRIITLSPSENRTLLWNAANGELITELPSIRPISVVKWSPDGTKIITISEISIDVFDTNIGAHLNRINNQELQLISASCNVDGTEIIAISKNNMIYILDTATGNIKKTLDDHECDLIAAKWSPNGAKIMTSAIDGRINIWDAKTYNIIETISLKLDRDCSLKWSPNGAKMLIDNVHGVKLYIRSNPIEIYSKLT